MGIKSLVKDKKGFTIIEVVLVLAIAGLIFLMVFLALPAMQRGQRDTQRKDDMARFNTALNNYSSNNNGSVPKDWNAFKTNYLLTNGDSFKDPSQAENESYNVKYEGKASGDITLDKTFDDNGFTIHVYTNAKCNGEMIQNVAGGRNVAFQYKLEGGGVYCGNN